MNQSRKRLISIILVVVLLILSGVAVFIAVRLTQDQAPDDSSAAVWCTGQSQCPEGNPIDYGGDRCYVWQWDDGSTSCPGSGMGECKAVNNCAPAGNECSVTFPGGVTGQIVINNCQETFTMEVYWRDAPRGSTGGDCVGTSSNRSDRTVGNGNYLPSNDSIGCGKCVQYDIDGRGVAGYTGDCPQSTCYRCTTSLTDDDTCESFIYDGSSCPSGSSSSPTGCASALNSQQCPIQVDTTKTTCYKCTDTLDDEDLCESFEVDGELCPIGSTTSSACEEAVGGACPITTSENLTCYRCTTSLSDGNTCESFVTTSESCPAGSTETAGECEDALGGVCPGELPETALFDNDRDNRIALGFIAIILGIIFYRFDITQRSLKLFGEYVSIDREAKSLEKKRAKRDRSLKNFENKVEGRVLKKK